METFFSEVTFPTVFTRLGMIECCGFLEAWQQQPVRRSRVYWRLLFKLLLVLVAFIHLTKAVCVLADEPCSGLTPPLLLSPAGGTGPDMAVDDFGRAHVVWRGLDSYIYYALVSSNHDLAIPATKISLAPANSPRVAVDSAGDAHIVATIAPSPSVIPLYIKVSNGVRVILTSFRYHPSFPNEQDFSPCIEISPVTQLPVVAAEIHAWRTSPSVLYNNEIMVMPLDSVGNPDRTSSWIAYSLASSVAKFNAQAPSLAVDAFGRRHCVWEHREDSWSGYSVAYANDSQSSWTEIANSRTFADVVGGPRMTAVANGNVDIVWSTTAGAVVWQENSHDGLALIDDTVISQLSAQGSRPRIAAGIGNIFFGWADSREGANAQIYTKDSVSTLSERNVVCSPGTTFSHAIMARGCNSFAFVWQDNKSGTNQIFYRAQRPTLTITPLRLLVAQADVDANNATETTIVPVTNVTALSDAPGLGLGVVADGVTPVVFKLSGTPTNYVFEINHDAIGYTNGQLSDRVRVLQYGSWLQTTNVSGSAFADSTNAFVFLEGLNWEDFTALPANSNEVNLTVTLKIGGTTSLVSTASLRIRPPPVVLIHGIADDASGWSSAFTSQLAQYRPTDFIVPISYGTGPGPKNAVSHLWPNATAPLTVLALELDQVLRNQFEDPLKVNWAFTRYDAVGHSQGGVLTRMLCQRSPSSSVGRFVPSLVISKENFYRGRFRRVITIGSPHNGTLLGWYMWKMRDSIDPLDRGWFSQFERGWFGLLAFISTDKFDPFGGSIAEANNPLFPPDPGIDFNCIQTAITGGAPPILTFNPLAAPPCYFASGLCFPTGFSGESRGQVILPNGSDGVVDYDSEGGGTGTQKTQITGKDIAHVDFSFLFGAASGQTTDTEAADTIGLLLNGQPNRFGAFYLPARRSVAEEQRYAQALILGIVVRNLINLLPSPLDISTNVNFQLQIPADLPNAGPINWYAQVFGTNGLSTNGLLLSVNTNDSTLVTVSVDETVRGQVLLYANYGTTNGDAVFARPVVVVSYPLGTNLSSIDLVPTSATLSVGSTLSTSIWGNYTNGLRSLLYLTNGQVSYVCSNTNVAIVDLSGTITMKSFGTATVLATYGDLTAQTVVSTITPSIMNFSGLQLTNRSFQLSWIAPVGSTNIIQVSTNLVDWATLSAVYSTNGFLQFRDDASTNFATLFYRVTIPSF